MNILFALTYYLPHRTGLSLHVQRIAEAMADAGHRVTVLTSRFDRTLARDETVSGVRVIRLRSFGRISRGQFTPGLPGASYALIRENDVVNIHSPMLETPVLARTGRRIGRGVVITHHGDLTLPEGRLNRFIEAVVERSFHIAARSAHRLIAYTTDYAEHSKYLAPHLDKVTPIYPPIRLPAPSPAGVAALREKLAIGDDLLIGYAGRFVEEKRPDMLLRSVRNLNGQAPNYRIAFAGQANLPYETFFEQCAPLIESIRDRLHFLGLITNPQDLADFYAACDVLVLPSESECFGLVQVEAMLAGTPVIATNIPGARVPVQVTGMGKLVPPRDVNALGQAIREVAEAPDKFSHSRDAIESRFQFSRTLQEYEQAFRQAAVDAGRL